MSSLIDLSITFRNIIEELFRNNGFVCKKLIYGKDIYYCARDILKCLEYSEDNRKITQTLNKLRDEDKFTINDLETKYKKKEYLCHRYALSETRQEDKIVKTVPVCQYGTLSETIQEDETMKTTHLSHRWDLSETRREDEAAKRTYLYHRYVVSETLEDKNQELIDSLSENERRNIYINKQGLYYLIGNSNKPEAEPFKNFVYYILLPKLDEKETVE